MADKKISELDALTGANTADDDRLVIVDTSAGLTKNITMTEFKSALDTGSGFVRVTGDTMTGDLALSGADVTFGDNDKAIFGAGSDLQIYHDGSNSYISDQGTGNIILDADDSFQVKRGANTSAVFDTNAEVALYHNNAVKLATTSTGVDITGTLTSDSLTVENTSGATLNVNTGLVGADSKILLHEGSTASPANGASIRYAGSTNEFSIGVGFSVDTKRLSIARDTGDISFYEDTGTTPKFFWDTSQETLRIGSYNGGGTPSGSLFVDSNANNHAIHIEETGGGSESWQIGVDADGDLGFYNSTSTTASVTFDDSGNVGIGTSSPYSSNGTNLEVYDADTIARLVLHTGTGKRWSVGSVASDSRLSFYDIDTSSEVMQIDSSGNLLVGTSSESGGLQNRLTSHSAGKGQLSLIDTTAYTTANVGGALNLGGNYRDTGDAQGFVRIEAVKENTTNVNYNYAMQFSTTANGGASYGVNAMRIDSSGNLLVGKASAGIGIAGFQANPTGDTYNTVSGNITAYYNRLSSDGDIVQFRKDGTTVGSIGSQSGPIAAYLGSSYATIGAGNTGIFFSPDNDHIVPVTATSSATRGDAIDLGASGGRFKDLYLSGGIEIENGTGNVGVGKQALNSNTASNNTAVGYQAAYTNTTGLLTAIGRYASRQQTTGTNNTSVGLSAAYNTTTGSSNTALGHEALNQNTTASRNVAVGYQTLYANTTGYENVAMGTYALDANTNGIANTAIGDAALSANTTASNNTSVGSESLKVNTTGASNTALGKQALVVNTTGVENTALGYTAGASNTTSSYSTFIGKAAGYYSTGAQSTYVGEQSGYYITSGAKNTILGRYNGNQGGLDIRTSSNNIVLADGDGNPRVNWDSDGRAQFRSTSSASAGTLNSALISGDGLGASLNIFSARPNNNAYYNFVGANVSNTVTFIVLGTGNVTNTNNSYGGISDVKLKENIVDASSQWDDIKALTVRKYSMKADELDAPNRLGVIAQEVEAAGMSGLVLENIDRDEDMHDLGTVTKTVNYSILYMKAVKALQEAMTRIETLETQNASFEARITALEGA